MLAPHTSADGTRSGGRAAPFGDADPCSAIRTAVRRRTAQGSTLGEAEAVSLERALALLLASPDRPGGPLRTVALGQPADLVLLDGDLDRVLADPDHRYVVATIRGARVVYAPDADTRPWTP